MASKICPAAAVFGGLAAVAVLIKILLMWKKVTPESTKSLAMTDYGLFTDMDADTRTLGIDIASNGALALVCVAILLCAFEV
jgi:hypothetical protein